MNIPAGKTFFVELEESTGIGTSWIVRVYRKTFLFKKRISSDWFLDGDQARTFAEQLARELSNRGSGTTIKEREPGWTLHRPPR
ncbi:MAG: hypothetical protein O7D34_03880 [Ignavibacteria bacterium]|nr:hypothetical protein [Ignavibacteria bacterium]